MENETWIPIAKVKDEEEIYLGTVVRIYDILDSSIYYDYIVSSIFGNDHYLQLTCFTQGEGGNIGCIIRLQEGKAQSSGKELKKVLDSGDQNVFVSQIVR